MTKRNSYNREFSEVLEFFAGAVVQLDREGNILQASKEFEVLTGYDFLQLTEMNWMHFDHSANRSDFRTFWEKLRREKRIKWKAILSEASGRTNEFMIEAQFHSPPDQGPTAFLRLNTTEKTDSLYDLLEQTVLTAKMAAWEWDLQVGTFRVTEGFYKIFELSKDEVAVERKNIVNLLTNRLHPDQIRELTTAIKHLQQMSEDFEKILPVSWNDVHKTILFKVEPIQLNGQVKKLRGIIKELPREESSNRLTELARLTLEQANEMVFYVTEDHLLIYANDSALTELRYTVDELVGTLRIFDIDFENTAVQWKKFYESLKDTRTLNTETSFQRKDGTVLPVELSMTYLADEKGDLISVIARNITQRRQEESRLKASLLEIESLTQQLEKENIYLQEESTSRYNFKNIISRSKAYKKVLKQVEQVAPTDSTVLIEGETGTGKELIARAIHQFSTRSRRPLIKVDCGALQKELIESELFGHEKGAFTGAGRQKLGRFEIADEGTIFLDEIGELPLDVQAKLLRVLQEGEFERLGGNATISVNVRIIAATNRKLDEMVKKGTFRQDLFYRLHVFPIENMPLRERKEDILLLTEFFISKFARKLNKTITAIRPQDSKRLEAYSFPGNIRELENIIERAVILTTGNTLNLSFWRPTNEKSFLDALPDQPLKTLDELQRQYIIEVLEYTKWRVSGAGGAAELLGLKSQTLFSKMRKFGIKRK